MRCLTQDKMPEPQRCLGDVLHARICLQRIGFDEAALPVALVLIRPASVLPAASISKQFTAMSILLLAKRGQLSLDDDVGKYIPEWADHGSRITIRHLLTHTSGLRDAFMLQGLAPPREDGSEPNDGILKILARTRGLNFAPGTEFNTITAHTTYWAAS